MSPNGVDEKALLAAHQAAFTAGPMTLDVARNVVTAYISALPERAFIVTLGAVGEHGTIQPADNRELLAELLEALTAMLAENGALHVKSINSDSPAEKLARAAIKKATGA